MIIEYADNPKVCKNLKRKRKCKSFRKILKGSRGLYSTWIFDLETEAFLVAKGMCQKIYERIEKIRYFKTLELYMKEHPVFKNDEVENQFKADILELIKNRYSNPYDVYGIKSRYRASKYLERHMTRYIGNDHATSIATLYRMGTIDIIDVGKCFIAFGDFS